MRRVNVGSRLNTKGDYTMDSRHALALMVGTALAGPGVAQDQGPPTDEIGPVIVTAERYVSTEGTSASKSDIPLVEMPQSVSVVSRDMIDLLNWTSLNESVRYSAGATGEAFGPDERYDWLQIRGFDPVQFIDGVQAPIGSVNNTGTDLYGSEAVEVLKGPASVLYGQGPPGGIVNMVSRRPQDVVGGEIEVQGGEYNMWQVAGDLTGPLGERTSGRITALYRDRETQVDFLTSKRLFISPAVKFEFSEDTQLTLLANYQDDDLENQSTGFLPIYGTMLPNPLGKVPVGRNLGETGYNFFKREQWSAGYDFTHHFNDRVSIQQNLKYFDVKVDSQAVFGAGTSGRRLRRRAGRLPHRHPLRSFRSTSGSTRCPSIRACTSTSPWGASSSRCWSASTTATTTASPNSALASARRRRSTCSSRCTTRRPSRT